MKKNCFQFVFCISLLFTLIFSLSVHKTYALKGNDNSHDPSTLIKDGTKYWMFTTGQGIYAAYSTDLISWTSGPKTVFPIGTWPSWINSAVPGFDGTFWAPDCFYMNGKYYLYYSVSTFGSSQSAIGVATSPTLDQNSPNYVWTDLGMVVSSISSTQINAIDPAIFKNSDGKLYMTYGSFSGGIGIIELNTSTGKVKNGATVKKIAGGNGADWEAPSLIKEGSYYYLFVNRGYCCRGVNSTYRIVMGRSTSVTGPFVDMSGVGLNNNGGTQVLGTSGKYIGPGHFGLLRENGSNFVSIHYYDGNDNGNAKLDILNLGFSGGWPFLTRDWVAAGLYSITNKNSSKVWDAWGCTGAAGQSIAQGTWSNLNCQKWNFTPVGDGVYKITNSLGGRSADVINCNAANGAKLQLWDWLNNNCQKFKIERTADGSHVLTSLTGTRVVEVPNASTADGIQLALWDYNGHNAQKWLIASTTASGSAARIASTSSTTVTEGVESHESSAIIIYPNPVRHRQDLHIHLSEEGVDTYSINLFDQFGKVVYQAADVNTEQWVLPKTLTKGMYLVQIKSIRGILSTKRIIVE